MERCTLARTPSMSWPCHPAKLAHLACFARRTARDLTMSRFVTVSRFRAFDRRSRNLDLRLAVPKHPFSRSSLGWSNRQCPELACGIIQYTCRHTSKYTFAQHFQPHAATASVAIERRAQPSPAAADRAFEEASTHDHPEGCLCQPMSPRVNG